jgi:hypothetical protein
MKNKTRDDAIARVLRARTGSLAEGSSGFRAWWAGILVAMLLVSGPAAARAETLTGIWRINGMVLAIIQDGSGIVVRTLVNRDDTGMVKVRMDGDVRRLDGGGLRFLAMGKAFPMLYGGQRCETMPMVAAQGQVVGDFGGRIFRAAGSLGGIIKCPDGTVGEWGVSLDGIWK